MTSGEKKVSNGKVDCECCRELQGSCFCESPSKLERAFSDESPSRSPSKQLLTQFLQVAPVNPLAHQTRVGWHCVFGLLSVPCLRWIDMKSHTTDMKPGRDLLWGWMDREQQRVGRGARRRTKCNDSYVWKYHGKTRSFVYYPKKLIKKLYTKV